MPPYTPDELYAALIANAATLENEDAANQLASGLRAFSDIVHGMAAAADAETTSPAVHRVTAVVVSRPIVTREDHRPSHSVTCRTVHGREGLTRRVACCASLPPPPRSSLFPRCLLNPFPAHRRDCNPPCRPCSMLLRHVSLPR